MTPNNDNLARLEQFLTSSEHQSKEEAFAELASHSVDVSTFKARVGALVRKGYQQQFKLAAQSARVDSTRRKAKFGDLMAKPLSDLAAIFERIRAGEFGSGSREAALARCRNLQGHSPSEAELRSWLEDIATLENNESGDL